MNYVKDYEKLVNKINDIDEPVAWFECLEEIGNQAALLIKKMERAGLDEMIDTALGILPMVRTKNPQVNAISAITLGALIENGMPPHKIEEEVIEEFINILELSKSFIEIVEERAPLVDEEEIEDMDENNGGYWVDEYYVSPELAQEFWLEENRYVQAYQAMDQFVCCIVTIFSADLKLAHKYNNDELNELVYYHDLSFIRMLLNILSDEKFLVIHPDTKQGFQLTINGISDNFQLHTLLADALAYDGNGPDWGIPARRPSESIINVVNGKGPQESEEVSKGVCNLYNWTVLKCKDMDSADLGEWIWNEGIPSDIEKWKNTRVIVLGPPSYTRTWNTGKSIPHLKPEIKIEKILNQNEVSELIDTIKNS